MIAAVLAFLLVATLIGHQSRARRVRSAIEAGTFAGLAAEIELLCSTPTGDVVAPTAATVEPLRLAA